LLGYTTTGQATFFVSRFVCLRNAAFQDDEAFKPGKTPLPLRLSRKRLAKQIEGCVQKTRPAKSRSIPSGPTQNVGTIVV
jgi:hypothetical protein